MPYQFVTERHDYSDYASGRVFYNALSQPAFPVRLTSEIFQRCLAIRHKAGITGPVRIYEPCCGSAYHLTALAYLHWHGVEAILASDIDAHVLAVAQRNLNLLTERGLGKRQEEITEILAQYGKPSHAEALESAQRLLAQIAQWTKEQAVRTGIFLADATDGATIAQHLRRGEVDLVLADVPYGQHSAWRASGKLDPLWQMLEALRPILSATSIVAIAANKVQRISPNTTSAWIASR
jgi:23S rRNA (guanine2535-N1)-methyltransferase